MVRTILIFEVDSAFSLSLNDFFTSNNFNVVGSADNVKNAVELISIHKPDIITSSLKLRDGSAISIFEFLRNNVQHLNFKPLCFVISGSLNNIIRTYLYQQAQFDFEVIYLDKNNGYKHDNILSLLNVKKYYFNETTSTLQETDSLNDTIRKTLISYRIPVEYKGFRYLLQIIEYVISEDLYNVTIEDLYTVIADELEIDCSTVKKGISSVLKKAFPTPDDLHFSTSPKRFVERVVNDLR